MCAARARGPAHWEMSIFLSPLKALNLGSRELNGVDFGAYPARLRFLSLRNRRNKHIRFKGKAKCPKGNEYQEKQSNHSRQHQQALPIREFSNESNSTSASLHAVAFQT